MISLAIFAGLFSACKKDSKDNEPDVKPVATVSQQDLTGAFASLYSEWEKTTTIPSSQEPDPASIPAGTLCFGREPHFRQDLRRHRRA